MIEKPMTFFQWIEHTTGGRLASEEAMEPFDLAELAERVEALGGDVQEVGRVMLAAYHSYICAFVEAMANR